MTAKRIIAICVATVMASICFAQENESVRKTLEERYGITNVNPVYESGYEGWYEICIDFYTRGVFDNNGNSIVPVSDHTFYIDYEKDCIIVIKNAYRDEGYWKDKILGIYSKNGTLLLPCEYT